MSTLIDNCVGLPPTVTVPDGCVVVPLRDCDGPDGRVLPVISGDSGLLRVVQSPSDYRIVTQATVDEYAEMCKRHDAEIEQFWARLIASPRFKVTVTLDSQ